MNEFYEFNEQNQQSRSHIWKYVAISLIFTLLGAMLMYYIIPYLNVNGTDILMDNQNEGQQDLEGQTSVSLGDSLLQSQTENDIKIDPNNPVVDIAEKVGPAVVGITNKSVVIYQDFFWGNQIEREQEGYGSGIIISKDGYIVTNSHVVSGAKELYVILQGGKKVKAELVGSDPRSDVAVVKIDHPDLVVAKLGDSDKIKQGELAVAIGNPLGHELAGTVTVGYISAVNRKLQVQDKILHLIQTDAAINPGNSGGALVNVKGEVIGMNTVKITQSTGYGAEGLGFAIPSNDFKKIVEEIVKYGEVERPWLGIRGGDMTAQLGKELGYPENAPDDGVFVSEVYIDGPAGKAGLLPRDIIIEFDDKKIQKFEQVVDIISQHKVGDIVNIKVWRNQKIILLSVKLEKLSE
jgi:serine protease Do